MALLSVERGGGKQPVRAVIEFHQFSCGKIKNGEAFDFNNASAIITNAKTPRSRDNARFRLRDLFKTEKNLILDSQLADRGAIALDQDPVAGRKHEPCECAILVGKENAFRANKPPREGIFGEPRSHAMTLICPEGFGRIKDFPGFIRQTLWQLAGRFAQHGFFAIGFAPHERVTVIRRERRVQRAHHDFTLCETIIACPQNMFGAKGDRGGIIKADTHERY